MKLDRFRILFRNSFKNQDVFYLVNKQSVEK